MASRVRADREVVVGQPASAAGENRLTVDQARHYWLLAESYLTRLLFGGTLRRIATLAPAGSTACRAPELKMEILFEYSQSLTIAKTTGWLLSFQI